MTNPASAPVVAYVVGQYPATTHSFVRREVAALRARGVQVQTFSIHRARTMLGSADGRESITTTSIRPIGFAELLSRHLQALRHSPRAYVKTLWFALARGQAHPRWTLWQLFYFGEAIVLWSHCHRAGISHIHSHFANTGADVGRLAAAFMRFSGVDSKWSFTMHGSAEFLDIKGYRLARKVEDADFVACISEYCRAQLMWLVDYEHWPKLQVVRCGVPRDLATIPRPHVGVLPGVRILTVGRLIGHKGQGLLIQACELLRERGLDASVRIVGDGPMEEHLRALVRDLGLEECVAFLGPLGEDDVATQLDWADVFCLPSMMEGLPVVLMEAMARGTPVVATRITGVPELVADGESGLLVSPGRADLLADAVQRLADDPDLRAHVSAAGLARVRSEFDVDDSARRLEYIFRRLQGRDGGSDLLGLPQSSSEAPPSEFEVDAVA